MIKIASVYIVTTGCQYLKTQLQRTKKIFKDFSLEIVTESNLSIENYLDVTLNGSFRPCGKPYHIIQYIKKESKQPPNLIRHLPASIEKRLSNKSSDESSIYCEDTLNKAGYIDKIVY